jgi:cytochrome c-type protein NapB
LTAWCVPENAPTAANALPYVPKNVLSLIYARASVELLRRARILCHLDDLKRGTTMKRLILIVAAGLAAGLIACSQMSISDKDMSLAKGSPLDPQPTPKAYTLDGSGAQGSAETAYLMPPLAKHDTAMYLPITRDDNKCLSCHDRPGAKKKAGDPTPIPSSHYTKAADGKVRVAGARWSCEGCHASAANVPDLVGNTGPKPKR